MAARVRVGEAVAPRAHAIHRDAARPHMLCLALELDDDRCGAARAAVERRVERALERHLAQARLEHAQRLEDVGDAAHARPRSHARRDRIAEAEHVDDVGPLQPLEGDGQRWA